jgi:hypothetical protein
MVPKLFTWTTNCWNKGMITMRKLLQSRSEGRAKAQKLNCGHIGYFCLAHDNVLNTCTTIAGISS